MKSFINFISRNRLYALINFFGLSVSLGFVILLFSYARQEYTTMLGQKHAKEIYAIGYGSGLGMTYSTGDKISGNIPEIKAYSRLMEQEWDAIVDGGNYYRVNSLCVDPNFFDFLSFKTEGCNKNDVFSSLDNILLSKAFAAKIFGAESPEGKTLVIKAGGKNVPLTIAGTIEDFDRTILQPVDIIMNINHPYLCSERVLGINYMDNFGSVQTLVMLDKNANRDKVRNKIQNEFKKLWDYWDKGTFIGGSSLVRADELYFSDINTSNNGVFRSGNKKMVDILFIAGIILLISALFNYINLTVAQTGSRAKEMATRNLLGASKISVIMRYISESFVFTFVCFAAGFFLAIAAAPYFQDFLDTELSLIPDIASVIIYLLLIFIISVISGLIPAFFVSRFKPIDVVKGNFSFRSKMVFGKVFIILQNIISVVLISTAFTMNSQMKFLINLPNGYNTSDIAYINIWGALNRNGINVLVENLKSLPEVESVGLCNGTPLRAGSNMATMPDGSMRAMVTSSLDSISFNMLGIKILEKYSDATEGMAYYTKDAAAQLGIRPDYVPDKERCLMPCGIIADYRQGNALYDKFAWDKKGGVNVIYMISDDYKWVSGLMVKTRGDHIQAMQAINKICTSTVKELTGFPKSLEVAYFEDILKDGLKGSKNLMDIVIAFMVMSVLISSLGLFAMSMYYTRQRAKSIALSKVFGSTSREVVISLSKKFMVLIIIALAIALPIAVYASQRYLETFPTKMNLSPWIFVAATLLSLAVAVISIFDQTLRAANANPVNNLKKE